MKKILFLFVFTFFSLFTSTNAQETFFQYGLSREILEVKFSPDRARLVSYSYDDGVFLWDVKSGRLLWHRKTGFVQKAREYYTLTSFAFSPDRKLLASGSGNGSLQLWDAETGKILWRADVHSDSVTAIEFTPDGKHIVSAASPKKEASEIKLVRVADGQAVSKLDGNPCTVVAMTFENEGQTLKAGNLDGNVQAWNLETRQLIEPQKPCRMIRTYEWETSFSPDLTLSAMRTGEKELTVKNTGTGEIVKKIEAQAYRVYSKFTGDGKSLIFSGYSGFTLYNLATGEARKLDEVSRVGSGFDLSLDGNLFAEGGSMGDGAIKITEPATGKSFFLDGHPGVVGGIAFTPDGKFFAVGGSDRNVYIFDAADKKSVGKISGNSKPIISLAISPNGEKLVAVEKDGFLRVWDWQTRSQTNQVESRFPFALRSVKFSPDGKYLLAINDSSGMTLYDANSWKQIRTFCADDENSNYDCGPEVVSANFSPDGNLVFAGHRNGTIRIWDIKQKGLLKKTKYGGVLSSLAAIGDGGKFLVAGGEEDQPVELIDSNSGRATVRFKNSDMDGFVDSLSLSPSQKYFVTVGISGVQLWSLNNLKPLREFEIGFSDDDVIAFSPDEKMFVIGGKNRNLLMFDTETGEKLWQLIPSYEPDALETELLKRREQAQSQVAVRKAAREKQAAAEVPPLAKKIAVNFSHYGTAESFWDQKIAESGAPDKSKSKLPRDQATVAWFTLTNDSDLPVSIDTNSMMFDPKCKGLCDGAEISSRYILELKDGKTRVNGFDMYSSTILPPKRSVYFSVALDHFSSSKAVYLGFTFQKENPDDENSDDYGTEQKIYLPREADLPK